MRKERAIIGLHVTDHALVRLAQRGIACSDVELILGIGSEVEDGILVRSRDCEDLERAIRSLLSRVHRLKGKRLVTAEGSLVTAYHADRHEERRLLRGTHGSRR